jgi:hypothetical protein
MKPLPLARRMINKTMNTHFREGFMRKEKAKKKYREALRFIMNDAIPELEELEAAVLKELPNIPQNNDIETTLTARLRVAICRMKEFIVGQVSETRGEHEA